MEESWVRPVAEQGPAIADRVPIFSLLGANAVSQLGDLMVAVAMPWFVLETTGSAAKTGLTGAAIGVGRSCRRSSVDPWWTGWASSG